MGIGGTGSYLVPCIVKTVAYTPQLKEHTICLYDGDNLEARNLERQNFGTRNIKLNKAKAMFRNISRSSNKIESEQLIFLPIYFTPQVKLLTDETNILICCADNHTARLACLTQCDENEQCEAIIAGNSTETAEAYHYSKTYRGHPTLDPRILTPEILLPDPHDPTHQCDSAEALEVTPQLAHINMTAATLILKLLWLHFVLKPEITDPEALVSLPTRLTVTPYSA